MTDTRHMLEMAAKACGYKYFTSKGHIYLQENGEGLLNAPEWNPLTNSGDCADMNAELGIATDWIYEHIASNKTAAVECAGTTVGRTIEGRPRHMALFKNHNNDPKAAWRYASTVVAGMMEKQS